MSRWKAYSVGCKRFKVKNPYKNEEAFNRAYNITLKVEETPVYIPREPKKYIATVKPKIVKAVKPKRVRKVISSEEEREINRTRWMRERREQWKEQGLTCRGTPYKIKPQTL